MIGGSYRVNIPDLEISFKSIETYLLRELLENKCKEIRSIFLLVWKDKKQLKNSFLVIKLSNAFSQLLHVLNAQIAHGILLFNSLHHPTVVCVHP